MMLFKDAFIISGIGFLTNVETFLKFYLKCALALCHSNADVERSLSTKKKMVIKSNKSLKPETLERQSNAPLMNMME